MRGKSGEGTLESTRQNLFRKNYHTHIMYLLMRKQQKFAYKNHVRVHPSFSSIVSYFMSTTVVQLSHDWIVTGINSSIITAFEFKSLPMSIQYFTFDRYI